MNARARRASADAAAAVPPAPEALNFARAALRQVACAAQAYVLRVVALPALAPSGALLLAFVS